MHTGSSIRFSPNFRTIEVIGGDSFIGAEKLTFKLADPNSDGISANVPSCAIVRIRSLWANVLLLAIRQTNSNARDILMESTYLDQR